MTKLTLRTPAVLGRTAFDQIFNEFFVDPKPWIKQSTHGYPITDLYKDDDGNQMIEMALAGFDKKDLEIKIAENTITISSNATTEQYLEGSAHRKIARRSFSRKFVDYDNQLDMKRSEATFVNGLLRVAIPKQKEAEPTVIKIK